MGKTLIEWWYHNQSAKLYSERDYSNIMINELSGIWNIEECKAKVEESKPERQEDQYLIGYDHIGPLCGSAGWMLVDRNGRIIERKVVKRG